MHWRRLICWAAPDSSALYTGWRLIPLLPCACGTSGGRRASEQKGVHAAANSRRLNGGAVVLSGSNSMWRCRSAGPHLQVEQVVPEHAQELVEPVPDSRAFISYIPPRHSPCTSTSHNVTWQAACTSPEQAQRTRSCPSAPCHTWQTPDRCGSCPCWCRSPIAACPAAPR